MERAVMGKFIIVLLIGILLISLIVISFIGTKREPTYDEFIEEFHYAEYDEQTMDDIREENILDNIERENYEDIYINKYGVIAMEDAIEKSKKAVKLYLEENADETMWKDISTSSFFHSYSTSLSPASDGLVRIIQQLDVHAAEPNKENSMRFTVYAKWNLSDGELVLNQQSKLFYVTLQYDKEWLVDAIDEL